jgi:hypothetical protein
VCTGKFHRTRKADTTEISVPTRLQQESNNDAAQKRHILGILTLSKQPTTNSQIKQETTSISHATTKI